MTIQVPAKHTPFFSARATRVAAEVARLDAVAFLASSPHTTRYLAPNTDELLVTADSAVLTGDQATAFLADTAGTVLIEPDHLSVRRHQELSHVRLLAARDLVRPLRAVKDRLEIAAITKAARVTCSALAELRDAVRPGVLELDLECLLWHAIRTRGANGWAFDPSIASGPRSARPWAGVTTRELTDGDVLTVDVGARVYGYVADVTRNYTIGPPMAEHRKATSAISRARDAALALLRPGTPARAVAQAVAACLDDAGYDPVPHAAGHGLGLELHEPPYLTMRSECVLTPGNVLNIEPGVYLGGWGVRAEDTVLITESGCRLLTEVSR